MIRPLASDNLTNSLEFLESDPICETSVDESGLNCSVSPICEKMVNMGDSNPTGSVFGSC